MVARLTCIMLSVFFALALGSSEATDAAEENGDLLCEVLTDKDQYLPGNPVKIVIRLSNVGDELLSLTFPQPPQCSYEVETLDGDAVYAVKLHMTVVMIETYLTLASGESHDYDYTTDWAWSQICNAGEPVDVPSYFVINPEVNMYSDLDVVLVPCTIAVSTSNAVEASFTLSTPPNSNGSYPAEIAVDASSSEDLASGNSALKFRWDWNGDGEWDSDWSASPLATHVYASNGEYIVRLEVIDAIGLADEASVQAVVWAGSSSEGLSVSTMLLLGGGTAVAAIAAALLFYARRRKGSPS